MTTKRDPWFDDHDISARTVSKYLTSREDRERFYLIDKSGFDPELVYFDREKIRLMCNVRNESFHATPEQFEANPVAFVLTLVETILHAHAREVDAAPLMDASVSLCKRVQMGQASPLMVRYGFLIFEATAADLERVKIV